MEADILLWIQNNIRNDVLTPIFKFITTLGNAGVIWIVVSVGLLIPKKTRSAYFSCLFRIDRQCDLKECSRADKTI